MKKGVIMVQYVFPAVLYKDSENRGYTIVLHDVNIFTEGVTVEDAFLRAKEMLAFYCKCAMLYNGEVDKATSFVDVVCEPKNIKLLIDAVLADGSAESQTYEFAIE